MSKGIAIITALPREVGALVKGWERRPAGHDREAARNVFVWTRGETVVACAGMGPERGALACEAAMKAIVVTEFISAGFAGACDPKLRVGDEVRAGLVIDAKTGERFEAGSGRGPVVVTSPVIANAREKRRLRETYGAAAVDMEGAVVARIARAHGLGFRAVKVISDEADLAMEGLDRFASADGQFREGAFALHVAMRPWTWGETIRLGRNGMRAARALRDALRVEID